MKLGRKAKTSELKTSINLWATVSEKKRIHVKAESLGKSVSRYLIELSEKDDENNA